MSEFFDPYNADRPLMLKCSCGRDHSPADHHAETVADAAAAKLRARSETADFEAYSQSFIEATLVKSLFPHDQERRLFLRAVGRQTAMAAIASVLPVASLVSQGRTKTGIEVLSHREHQVYLLLTQGRTVSEIGAHLNLAPNTVSTYRARILEKTGTKNDVELALYAQSHTAGRSPIDR